MSFDNQHAINILTYWHQTEFFNCIDLKELQHNKKGVIHYDGKILSNDPVCLPWLNRNNIRRAGKDYFPNHEYSYTLYLGIFKNSEFFEQASAYFDDIEADDWEERRSNNGLTCAAKIHVTKDGLLSLDRTELSTAPWALGQILKDNINNVRFSDFEKASEKLLHKLQSLDKLASNLKQNINISQALTTFEIIEILKILGDWAGFYPKEVDTAVIIKLNRLDGNSSQPESIPVPPNAVIALQQLSKELTQHVNLEGELDKLPNDETVDNVVAEEDKIPILNSFFLRDIERARELIKKGRLNNASPLIKYLSISSKPYPDLLKPEGEQIIRTNVSLDKTPLGRWPMNSTQSMSLMQQFAINTANQEMCDQGLYSVNGPPGTGKTTMLRDFVASNVVNRARVLSQLDHSHSAFNGDISVQIGDRVHQGVKQLIPDLTDYEMVVVSNNNSAVENISKELPQSKTIGNEFSDAAYLKPVAQKLAAKHDNKRNIYSLGDDEDCWGLVAAALGNFDNRKSFGSKVQFSKIESLNPIGEFAKDYSTLVPAIKALIESYGDVEHYFHTAQKEFKRAEASVKECITELTCLEKIAQAEKDRDQIANDLCQIITRTSTTAYFLSKIVAKKIKISNIKKWCAKRSVIRAFKTKLNRKKLKIKWLENKLSQKNSALNRIREKYEKISDKHAGVTFSCNVDSLESNDTQRNTFGHSTALNKARSELTVKAFHLHQAWLGASYEKCFSKNINIFNDLVTGNIKDYEQAKTMWQSFFMVIPVVSSSFASVANQFSKLREGDIGWLFIDEAGQATPQQAVGAIMRSQRVVVVGDPLQVEPVFTTPPEFVEYFGKRLLGKDWIRWSPTLASVQKIADEVNAYGTNLISDEFWLGSPLRVHRRCKDPMFTIANAIAYNHKMIHGSDDVSENNDFVWGESSWFDITGEVQGKHYVPEQGSFILELIYQHLDRYGRLPDCYIISPFKDVKFQLSNFLKRNFNYSLLNKENFNDWLDGRIGTVHTFQGKEEKNVLFVLGASREVKKAASWAASKPNLLNVAVTRAKKRIYIIGDKTVWGPLSYFSFASSQLPCRTAFR